MAANCSYTTQRDTIIGNTTQAVGAVAEGLVEIGFVEGAVNHPDLVSQPVACDRMVIVVAPNHPWAQRGAIQPDELCTTDWVLREPGSGTRATLEQALLARDSFSTNGMWHWSCHRTRRCVPRSKPECAPPRSPPRWRRRVSRRDCCIWLATCCRTASSAPCVTPNAKAAGRRRHG